MLLPSFDDPFCVTLWSTIPLLARQITCCLFCGFFCGFLCCMLSCLSCKLGIFHRFLAHFLLRSLLLFMHLLCMILCEKVLELSRSSRSIIENSNFKIFQHVSCVHHHLHSILDIRVIFVLMKLIRVDLPRNHHVCFFDLRLAGTFIQPKNAVVIGWSLAQNTVNSGPAISIFVRRSTAPPTSRRRWGCL